MKRKKKTTVDTSLFPPNFFKKVKIGWGEKRISGRMQQVTILTQEGDFDRKQLVPVRDLLRKVTKSNVSLRKNPDTDKFEFRMPGNHQQCFLNCLLAQSRND